MSRSFAFVIRCLPRRVGNAVMTSYLLCRIADTLEDSQLSLEKRRRKLAEFKNCLESGRIEIPQVGYPGTYRELMAHVDDVLTYYRGFDPEIRKIIARHVSEMCDGMAEWTERSIRTFQDQNRYCYYVAGLVGRLLTDLFVAYGHVDARRKPLLDEHAVSFGLALQKVNIIRDIRSDIEEGRCYWPSELLATQRLSVKALLQPGLVANAVKVMDRLIEDLWPYLEGAVQYVTLLPRTQLRVRMFCLIPLFMAVATVRKCRGNSDVFLNERSVKIPSGQVRSIILRALSIGSSNRCVRSWYRRWKDRITHLPPEGVSLDPFPAKANAAFGN